MIQAQVSNTPGAYIALQKKSEEIGFSMPSDIHIGTLLRSLIASKPNGRFLELGTGMGLSLSWMVDGMDNNSRVISLDNDHELVQLVSEHFQQDARVDIQCTDAAKWLENYEGESFDLVFADAWPGKYSHLNEVLNFIEPGGFYVIDDMNPQPNWPIGHGDKVNHLIAHLEQRDDLIVTKMDWSSGTIIAVKK